MRPSAHCLPGLRPYRVPIQSRHLQGATNTLTTFREPGSTCAGVARSFLKCKEPERQRDEEGVVGLKAERETKEKGYLVCNRDSTISTAR